MAAKLRALPGPRKRQPGHGKDQAGKHRTKTAAWAGRKWGWAPVLPAHVCGLWWLQGIIPKHVPAAMNAWKTSLESLCFLIHKKQMLPIHCKASSSCSSHSLSLSFPFSVSSSSQFPSLRSTFVPGLHLKPTLCLFPHPCMQAAHY